MNAVMQEHPPGSVLTAYSLGQLGEEELAGIDGHLADCAVCRQVVEGVVPDTLLSLLRSAATEPDSTENVNPGDGLRGFGVPQPRPRAANERPPEALANHPRYRVGELLGVGGMGVVYKAEHLLMERPVALKVLNRELIDKPATIERFRREVRAAARLTHPNIVAGFDAEQAGDVHFLVMEYVEGVSLARLIAEKGPLPVDQACDFVRQAALGLEHAHERGMVHRDIKPQNLMLTPGGQVKILDFGLARFVMESVPAGAMLGEEDATVSLSPESPAKPLTQIGIVMGTPDYIAPEQARDSHVADIRADIYSLGCTLYDLLAGHAPFPGGSAVQKVKAHLERTPRPLRDLRRDVPTELAKIIERMMAKDPAQRYQTPVEVAAALTPYLAPPKPPRRKRWPALVAGCACAAALIAGIVIYVQTDNGTIVIETDDNKIAVMIEKAGGVKIVDQANQREYHLQVGEKDIPSGNYQIKVSEPLAGLEFQVNKFELKRGREVRLTARLAGKGKGNSPERLLTASERDAARKRLDSLNEILSVNEAMYRNGAVNFSQVLKAKRDIAKVELTLCETDRERIKVYERLVALAQELVNIHSAQHEAGAAMLVDVLNAKAEYQEAKSDLENALARRAVEEKGPAIQGFKDDGTEKLYTFEMQGKRWDDVLEWLTEKTGRGIVYNNRPWGSFDFIGKPGEKYTLPQIIDIINEGLLAQKYLLLNRGRSYVIVPADQPIDPSFIQRIDSNDLDKHGKSEIVSILYQCKEFLMASASAPEIKKQMGPFGNVLVVDQFNQLILQDTAANLSRIKKDLDIQIDRGRSARLKWEAQNAKNRDAQRSDEKGEAAQSLLYGGKPASFWLNQLQDTNPKFRVEAVEALGSIAQKNKELIPVLMQALKDKDYTIEDAASKALGSLGTDAVPGLVEILKEKPSPYALNRAAVALGMIGPDAKVAVPFLIPALKLKEGATMRTSVTALGRIGPQANAALPAMVELLGDYLESVKALPGSNTFGPNSIPGLLATVLPKIDSEIQKALPKSGKFGPKEAAAQWQKTYETLREKYPPQASAPSPDIQPKAGATWDAVAKKDPEPLFAGKPASFWLRQLRDTDAESRAKAVEALGSLAKTNKELIPFLVGVVKNRLDPELGLKASKALAVLGPDVVPVLIEVLKDQYNQTSPFALRGAADALGTLGPQAKDAVPLLTSTLELKDWMVRKHVITALGQIGLDAKPAMPAMVGVLGEYLKSLNVGDKKLGQDGFLTNSIPGVLAKALPKIDPEIRDILPKISDIDFVRPGSPTPEPAAAQWQKAFEALQKRYPPQTSAPSPFKGLQFQRPGNQTDVRPSANGALYRGKPASYWLDQFRDSDPKFRAEAVAALGSIAQKNKDLIPVLVEALADKDYAVGSQAVAALGSLGQEIVPVILDVLKKPQSPTAFTNAAKVVGKIGTPAKDAVPYLERALKKDATDGPDQRAIILALGRIGPDAKPAIPAMVDKLGRYLESLKDSPKQGMLGPGSTGTGSLASPNSLPRKLIETLQQIDPDVKDVLPERINNGTAFLGGAQNWTQLKEMWDQTYEALKKKYQK